MSNDIYHIHHIIPKHMGGSNSPENLIKVTVEEHALAHKKLWEEHGFEEDRIAWLALSGQASMDEIKKMRQKLGRINGTKKIKENPHICRNGGIYVRDNKIGIHDPNKHLKSQGGKTSIKILQKSKWLWVTDGVKDTRVTPEKIEFFLKENPSYKRGRTFCPSKGKKNLTKNKFWVNNGLVNKRVSKEIRDTLINQGWEKGMLIK